ncbi:hypothetical protein FRC11_014941 [Ceratobasidium sp. 423]|nr:hypothetical protein FRC11_014941 [Ceratobasidium sp. 423]
MPSTRPSSATTQNPVDATVGEVMATQNSKDIAGSGLEEALRKLRIAADICPPFRSAVDGLTSCLHGFEAAARNRREYKDMTAGLRSLVEQLIRHLEAAPSDDIIDRISTISEVIRKEIESIGIRQSHSGFRRVLGASGDEDDLLRRYRRIEQLFRQIQGEASMSTWNITSKQYINTQLDRLHPANLARFDSGLSTEINRRTCTENTRTQILEESMTWSEDPNAAKIYWMNGMAGTGKTTIACTLSAALDARKQLAASFFCTRTSPECRDAKRMVPTIAYQFARRSTPFRSALCKALEDDPDIGSRTVPSQFDLLLTRPLMMVKDKLPDNLVVVIDALDECSDPHVVESFLGLLFRSIADLPIKFYVTSRPEPAIRNRMMSESERSRSILYLHEIEKSLVQADIELYLKEELEFMSPAVSDIRKLAEHAGNLFIYAATAVRYIRPTGKAVDSRTRLSTILAVNTGSQPRLSIIDALYSAILTTAIGDDELEPEEQDRMRLVLWTAICACEPIRISTLSSLCGLNNNYSVATALQPLQSVLHVSDRSELVTTLHASFPDYMLAKERSGVFFCDKTAHNQFLAQRCFQIMQAQLRFNICSIKSSFIPDDKVLGGPFDPDGSHQQPSTLGAQLFIPTTSLLGGGDEPEEMYNHRDNSFIEVEYMASPTAYTPHIYLSALPLSPASNALRLCYLPRYKGLVKVSGTLLEKLEGSELCTWKSNFEIHSAALWPDGDIIVLGSYLGEISMHNVYNGRCVVKPYKAHERPVDCLHVSNNGTQVVSGSDRILHVWSMQDGSLVSGPFKGHTDGVVSVSYSPDDAQIVSGSWDHTIGIWNAHDAAAPMRSFTGHTGPVNSVAFSPDGKCIASGSGDHTVRLWDLSTGTTIRILQHHRWDVGSIQFSPDGAHVISGSPDSRASIYISNVSDGSLCGQPIRSHSSISIAISPEGRIASADTNGNVCVWNKYTSEMIAGPSFGHTSFVRYVGFSGDGMCVISASTDNTVRVWNAHGRLEQVKRLPNVTTQTPGGHPNFAVSRNQTQVATFKTRGRSNIDVWDSHSGAPQTSISAGPSIEFVRFSLDGTRIISVHKPCDICIWDIHTANLIGGPHTCFASKDPQLFGCSADATRIVAWDRNSDKFELWDAQSHQLIAYCEINIKTKLEYPGFHYMGISPWYSPSSHTLWVMFSPDGKRFATQCSDNNGIQVWDADSGLCIAGPFPKKKLLDMSPDGTTILCLDSANTRSNPDRLQLINVDNGDTALVPGTSSTSKWSDAIFSLDGRYVANKSSTGLHVLNIFDNTHTTIQPAWFDKLESFTCSHDGWCLARGTSNLGNVLQVWRFHIDPPFRATIRDDGWVLNGESKPLFWAPGDIRKDFPTYTRTLIPEDGEGIGVDYRDMLTGDDWSKCYIGD